MEFLSVSGTKIVNGAGDEVLLRGTNAGGWLVHEEWMCPTKAPDAKTIRDTLAARFGEETRDALIDAYRDAYWTERDFDNCAAMGMTCLRLPFHYWDVAGFERLDWFVEHCARRGMYVVLDLHGAYGSQNGKHHSGQINDGRQLYFNEGNRAKTIRLWEEIARHYKGSAAVAMYDLLNEPERDTGETDQVQWDYYDELYRAVRAVDPDHIITMEACWWPRSLPSPKDYGWENVVYQYHHYPWGLKAAEDINEDSRGECDLIEQSAYGVPVFIGEFCKFNCPEAWEYGLGLYNALGYHWTTWCYKVTGDGGSSWGCYNHDPPRADVAADSAEEIRAKWARTGWEHAVETPYKRIMEKYLQ